MVVGPKVPTRWDEPPPVSLRPGLFTTCDTSCGADEGTVSGTMIRVGDETAAEDWYGEFGG
jgi:hypothetical protein